jgi:Family of unknown function (DUF6283)
VVTAPKRPAAAPCRTCPYRRDVPSGVWQSDEYAKLADYDRPTGEQPAGVFLCHQQDGRVCAGWAGCHDGDHLLALRLAAMVMDPADAEATRDYVSPVPLFRSGREAAEHGLRDVQRPGAEAVRWIARLAAKQARASTS